MTPWTFTILTLATWRTTVLVVDDWVPFQPVRDWVWRRWPYGAGLDPSDPTPAGAGVAEVVPWTRRAWQRAGGWAAGLVWSRWRDSIRDRDPHRPGRTRIGYLLTCPACAGVWVAGGWWVAWRLWPAGTVTVGTVAALAGGQLALERLAAR